jgi:YD repeat-containing protein
MTKNIKITENTLKQLNACQEGIDFFNRNKLNNFPYDKINKVQGDLDGMIKWHRSLTITKTDNNNILEYLTNKKTTSHNKITLELNNSGNVIKRTAELIYPDAKKPLSTKTTTYTYKNNILIQEDTTITPNVLKLKNIYKKYNDQGLLIEEKSSTGEHTVYTYDRNNRLVNRKSFADDVVYKYRGNKIKTEYFYMDKLMSTKLITLDKVGNKIDEYYMFTYDHKDMFLEYNVEYYPDGQLKSINDLKIPFFLKNQ